MQSSARIKSQNKIHIVDNQKKIKTSFLMNNQLIRTVRKQSLNQKQLKIYSFCHNLKQNPKKSQTESQQIMTQ